MAAVTPGASEPAVCVAPAGVSVAHATMHSAGPAKATPCTAHQNSAMPVTVMYGEATTRRGWLAVDGPSSSTPPQP